MELAIYQVDAFASRPFEGNPAAVVPLEHWLDDGLLQDIAAENNLSETAYFVPLGDPGRFHLRWFTPTNEVDLCGHATLASAHVLRRVLECTTDEVEFETRSGPLIVRFPSADSVELDFPARPGDDVVTDPQLEAALGAPVVVQHDAPYVLAELESEAVLRSLEPDFDALTRFGTPVIATARATTTGYDFVSRFFAPTHGVREDPVTGSAHCTSAPYWAGKLGREELHARQISRRGGDVRCRVLGDRVRLAGGAVLVLRGTLVLPG